MFLRRRMCRLHLQDPHPSLEGIWVGNVAGHYRLLKPELLEAEGRTQQLDGEVLVPRERVVFLQRLG